MERATQFSFPFGAFLFVWVILHTLFKRASCMGAVLQLVAKAIIVIHINDSKFFVYVPPKSKILLTVRTLYRHVMMKDTCACTCVLPVPVDSTYRARAHGSRDHGFMTPDQVHHVGSISGISDRASFSTYSSLLE